SRVPFLDYRLVELALSLPSGCKIRKGTTKYILRKAMKGLVSDRILERKDKIGFAAPDEDWLMSQDFIKTAREIFASGKFCSRRYWNADIVMQMLEEHLGFGCKRRKNHSEMLWRIINVELWMRIFMDSAGPLKLQGN
ncbi:MAG: hypothetical protein QG575_292, partial [Euryarchaeota archaeon]|nr:hypothetical protein [Euryarchaeota archaeon]